MGHVVGLTHDKYELLLLYCCPVDDIIVALRSGNGVQLKKKTAMRKMMNKHTKDKLNKCCLLWKKLQCLWQHKYLKEQLQKGQKLICWFVFLKLQSVWPFRATIAHRHCMLWKMEKLTGLMALKRLVLGPIIWTRKCLKYSVNNSLEKNSERLRVLQCVWAFQNPEKAKARKQELHLLLHNYRSDSSAFVFIRYFWFHFL